MVAAALLGALALLWQAAALVPSAPLNLVIKKITSTEIHLTWMKPLNNTPNQFVSSEVRADASFSHLPSLVPLDDHENTNFAISFTGKYVGGDTFGESKLSNEDYHQDDDENAGETRRTSRGRFFHRKKRRRDAISDKPDLAKILADPSSERPAPKKKEFVETTVQTTTESPEMLLNYVLFYEEGASGESVNYWKGELIQKKPENKSLERKIEMRHGKDGFKGVGYVLKGLKPYTYYRIWVRAFYASVLDNKEVYRSNLGPPSYRIVGLTDVMPPSQPVMKNVTCNQPPGALYIQWGRPEVFTKGLDLYTITLQLQNSKKKEDFSLNTTSEQLELATNSIVTISDNMSIYEVTIHASTLSIVHDGLYINGTPTEAYQVVMTPDCVAAPPFNINIGQGAELGSDDEIIQSGSPLIGYLIVFLILLIIVLCAILGLYYWGCSLVSVFKKCYPMSYLFLDEGGTIGGSDGCGEAGLTGKSDTQLNCTKKNITSPTHAVIYWDAVESIGANLANSMEHLCDALHPPVPADKFLAHTAALHADGDIGFGKEYELIQSKSTMLAHTSHHSQHPDNKHKNRYLNITAYDHSRVCLLPSSSCSCEPGREHRKSCTSKLSGSQNGDSPPHCDYVNANFIDGIVAELDPELSKYIIEQNNKRIAAQKKKLEAADAPATVHPPSDLWITVDESQRAHNFICPKPINEVESNSDTKNLLSNFNGQDDARCTMKGKLSLDLEKKDERRILSPNSEILASTCRLSINLDRKEDKQDDVKSEKSLKELKSKKRSTSADTKDIVIDKKGNSRGHSKNSSVVVATIDNSPLNNAPKIEGAFLNIEFSGIVDDKEVKKVNNLEKLNEINGNTKEPVEETLDDLDDLFVKIDGEEYRVNSSWLLDRRRYIGTQGPTPGTLPAFWRMVWDHKVVVIVMITNLVERGRRKCDMYWPKDGTENYGAFQVTTLQEDVMATYTVRTFEIKNTKLNTSRPVLQYHYTVWPDHGTPEHPIAVLRFREAARKAAPPQAGAVLVHCSAGVGRTGTYIVLDAMLNHLKLTGSLNVFGFLCHVRTQRNFLVQTEEQYVFIHDALLEAIQSGNTEVSTENAKEYLKKLLTPFPDGYIHDSMLNIKCGLYGAPLKEKPPAILAVPRLCNDKINRNNSEECDFAMWSNVDDVRYSNDKSLEECRNDIVSIALQDAKLKQNDEAKSDKNHLLNGEKDTDNSSNSNCEPEDNNKAELEDMSPELILDDVKDDEKIIDFEEDNVCKKKNGETISTCSNNAQKSENQSNSFEKVNGNCNNESKASSISNEDIELSLNDNNSNGLNCNGNKSAEKVAVISLTGENSNTITSSISSDTNNMNMTNFRDKDSNSPMLSNQDNTEYNKKKNYRIKYDDNYELLSNSVRPDTLSGLPMDCFAGSHQFSCQRKDFGNIKPKNLLEQQFKMITSFEPSKFHTMSAGKQVNITKNRQGAVLPIESGRVHLIPKPGIEGTDYINATWLQGHRSLREYVVTQHPLIHTVTDLYRLLWDHTCQIVVILTDHTEDSECKLFWPTEKNPEITTYNYNIRYISEVKHVAKRIALCDIGNKKNLHKLLEDDSSLDTPLHSPSSINSNKAFNLNVNRGSQRVSPVSHVENQDDHCMSEEKLDNSFYRRQFSNDKQDEEKLIPKSDESNLESEESDELKKLNSESKPEGYMFDKSELQIDTTMCNNVSETSKLSPKKCSANGDPFNSNDDAKKSQKSPSKLSLRSFKLSSPILKSPIKFDFGAKNSNKLEDNHDVRSQHSEEQTNFESKFVMIPLIHMCQLREGSEDIGLDCVITTTHITMSSLQDDYELKIKLIECPKWLADLDYDENSDTDDESQEDEYEMEAKDLDYVIEQRLKAYKGVFALPEYMAKCQDEAKNSPVVVVDKLGGARATALCTLGGVLRQKSRDVYSLAKLHHGRRAGAWRRPADLRALYEALAAYEHPPLSSSNPT